MKLILNRIKKVEQLLLLNNEYQVVDIEENLTTEWLVKNNEEFRECLRSIYRLQNNAGSPIEQFKNWKAPFKEKAFQLINRMNELMEIGCIERNRSNLL
ncbi:hypothetical protein H1D32_01010 [Anaerobacillus sp. CMMVII]|uniref:hypothetical protein n=1 Tax=Anaerobacillus sp. CMMVII TaxID=2755588 RepID=UPI0021B75DA2|nr:hypothetical protein [Anaerobacillus sp. CMMVII]MCT8136475.1 hypothetical protein [Anaerobacillus sp. CMMVII]